VTVDRRGRRGPDRAAKSDADDGVLLDDDFARASMRTREVCTRRRGDRRSPSGIATRSEPSSARRTARAPSKRRRGAAADGREVERELRSARPRPPTDHDVAGATSS